MELKIIDLKEKQLIGIKSQMLQHQYQHIAALWKAFMPKKHQIKHLVNTELIALQSYSDFGNFKIPFDIWACTEVSKFEAIPKDMTAFTIPKGLYAIYRQKGTNAAATYQKIMLDWLPISGYMIDDRPHFQVMGEAYKNGSPDSEEDFYIPVKPLKK